MKRVAFWLALVAAAPAAAQSPRAPYLQSASEDAMTIVWRSDTDPPPNVCYGASPDALDDIVPARVTRFGAVDQLEARVTGLTPATRYFYSVGHAACPPATSGDPNQHFTTAPVAGTRGGFRFWVVGDSGTGGTAQRNVFDAMRAEAADLPPDLFVHVGDMAYDRGTTSEFDVGFYDMYAPLLSNTPVWPALGNHEGASSDSATESGPYYEGYVLPTDGRSGGVPSGTEAYYSFDYANVHFIVLDSYDSPRSPMGAMVQWLEMDLAAADAEWLIAYWHHPPYTDGTHQDDESQQEDMRRQVLPVLEAAGVDLILAGHSHIYERSYLLRGGYYAGLPGGGATAAIVDSGDGRPTGDGPYASEAGTLYVVAGHGGTGVGGTGRHPLMAFTEIANGSCLVDVEGGLLTLRNVRADGAVTDEVVLVKEDGIFVTAPSGGSYLAGSDIEVLWTSVGAGSGEVRVEYSLDDGASWTVIADRTADDGALTWSSPRRMTTQGRVRVTDTVDAARSGTSARAFTLSAETDVTLVPAGGVWEYWDDAAAPAADWLTTTGGWSSGPAQLGYGDGDEATVLADEDPNVPSAYFRRTVTVDGDLLSLSARVVFDDGFALFVDGVMVGGANVDDGVGHDTFASATSSDNEVLTLDLDPSLLPAGEHVIAVIVKQANGSSSDLSFDLSLEARVRVAIDPPGTDAGVPDADGGSTPSDGAVVGPDAATAGVDAGPGGDGGGDGCGCRVGARPATPGWLALLGLAVVVRIRRASGARRRSSPRP
ncbi:MAG: metallophosphoesterase family protein [Sandaracinaceae bacterium]|nr:metallophosphoesterase family protein [Sandaracinaceae bacterium]